jgi:dihydrofolate reductase
MPVDDRLADDVRALRNASDKSPLVHVRPGRGLKLILAVSADGLLASGDDDDMSWTGRVDKTAFRLLTNVGGLCGAGYRTLSNMPPLSGRSLVLLTRDPGRWLDSPVPPFPHVRAVMRLEDFACEPGAWLLGGPRLAAVAVGKSLVDEAFICRIGTVQLLPAVRDLRAALVSGELLGAFGAAGLREVDSVHIGDGVSVSVFRRRA